ncbi:MAG: TraB/GumN family protein [Methylophilaceae bacterium]
MYKLLPMRFIKYLLPFALALTSTLALSQPSDIGLLWKAESPTGKTSYLFATMHSDDARITNFSAEVINAISESDSFMVEVLPSTDNSSYFLKEPKLSSLLTESEFDKIVELADFHSMPTDVALNMKPWLLAIVFDLPKPNTIFSQDNQLLGLAQRFSKPVTGLESTVKHFETLDSFTIDEQLVMLRAVLKRSQEEKERDFEMLINAYLSGDILNIAQLDEKITSLMLPTALWEKMRIKFLDERNTGMALSFIEKANKGNIFVAVGASHLAGNNGLISRLRESGFKLTPVNALLK